MRYAFISDIHGNLPALDAVLADIAARGDIDAVYHLGDLVGYSPWPNEVVERLRSEAIAGVAGNYDSTVATAYKHCGCRSENAQQEALAHASYAWTLAHVSAETRRFLGGLPMRLDLRPLGGHVAGPTITLVHATPPSNLVYVTEDRPDAFLAKMAEQAGLQAGDVLCFGHTHKPWSRVVDGVTYVNTGSVGRPKDGDPRAGYVVVEFSEPQAGASSATAAARVAIQRVAYDVDKAARGVIDAGLPAEFAEFLRRGGN
jgi:predicted phosphodiesterase